MDSTNIPKQYKIIYPAYIDKNRTIAQGRRVPVKYAVDRPKTSEMIEVLRYFGYKTILENHSQYPRGSYPDEANIGRIRVFLETSIEQEHKKKMSILKLLGEQIPKLKSRSEQPHTNTVSSTSSGQAGRNPKPKKKRK